jgi:hypothetical protein
MKAAEPCERSRESVNSDVASGRNAELLGAFTIGGVGIGRVQCKVKAAVGHFAIDRVLAFRRFVIPPPFLRADRRGTNAVDLIVRM